jgi:hypothetical protein
MSRAATMKTFRFLLLLACLARPCIASSTINEMNRFSYGANIGWMDWRADGTNGVVVGEFVCSGYIYSANVGWISVGSGSPTNGIQYQNLASNDFGVNLDGIGNLRGFAYGANIGWINFESQGAPKIDLATGKMSGFAYSANCGWISLSNAFAQVQTDTIAAGADTDSNGLPDAWEIQHFGAIGVDPNADPDHDGMSNLQEYIAGTDPNNGSDYLRITELRYAAADTKVWLTWSSSPTRFYFIEQSPDSTAGNWTDSGLGMIDPAGTATTRAFVNPDTSARFFRIRAVRPLQQ